MREFGTCGEFLNTHDAARLYPAQRAYCRAGALAFEDNERLRVLLFHCAVKAIVVETELQESFTRGFFKENH